MLVMDCEYDGHMWMLTKTMNIRNIDVIKFQYAQCVGHLRCGHSSCPHVHEHGCPNEIVGMVCLSIRWRLVPWRSNEQ